MKSFPRIVSRLIFASRWLQAPLYLGLIAALGVYVYKFAHELYELVTTAALLSETKIMLIVISLIDVVMVANLLIMVIVGGYETFVSRLRLQEHPDQPEWLGHLDAGTMKIKVAMALIGISSIHLLRTFLDVGGERLLTNENIFWQVVIHMTFVFSSLLMAYTNRLIVGTHKEDGY